MSALLIFLHLALSEESKQNPTGILCISWFVRTNYLHCDSVGISLFISWFISWLFHGYAKNHDIKNSTHENFL